MIFSGLVELVVFWRRKYNAAVGKRGGKKREGQGEEVEGSELGAGNRPYNTAEMAREGKVGEVSKVLGRKWMERRRRALRLD